MAAMQALTSPLRAVLRRAAQWYLERSMRDGIDLRKLRFLPDSIRLPFQRDGLDPVPAMAEVRDTEPVKKLATMFGRGIWLVSGYDEARQALADADKTLEARTQAVMAADQRVDQARETLQQARIEVETAGVRRAGVAEQLEELGQAPLVLLEELPDDADAAHWSAQIEALERRIQAIAPDGAIVDDFVILTTGRIVNICNAPSPAATSSLHIGLAVVDKLAEQF